MVRKRCPYQSSLKIIIFIGSYSSKVKIKAECESELLVSPIKHKVRGMGEEGDRAILRLACNPVPAVKG